MILVGRSGENIGDPGLGEDGLDTIRQAGKERSMGRGRWLLLVILSGLFVFENILVCPEHLPRLSRIRYFLILEYYRQFMNEVGL